MHPEVERHTFLTDDLATRLAGIILSCLHREYPHKPALVVSCDGDWRPAREATPTFFGCFDWHSAVHSHWALLRLLTHYPDAPFADPARNALETSFAEERLAGELAFQQQEHRRAFEMPYGVAWFLYLAKELREVRQLGIPLSPRADGWYRRLEGLEQLFRDRFDDWLLRLPDPIRSGEHFQSAFALDLVLDWARTTQDERLQERIVAHAQEHHAHDRHAPLAYEPSAHDFLSPSLGVANLMARVYRPVEFATWLDGFFGDLPRPDWPQPVTSSDPTSGKLAHYQGLNLSRARMMYLVADALPTDDARVDFLRHSARDHAQVGIAAATGEHYAGAHWLSSFVVHLVT